MAEVRQALPKMGQLIKDKDEIWDKDFSDLVIDRELTERFATKNRGSVRISSGLFYTKKEYEIKRKKILSEPLP